MKKFVLTLSATFLFLLTSFAQTKVVTGRVTDETGQPISKASVEVKGTNLGVATQADGTFSITVPNSATTLVVSGVDMVTREVAITDAPLMIALVSKPVTLQDVVVTVPYGTIKKSAFTGSENTISSATINKQQVTSVTRTLEGLVPGVIATNGGGEPGTGASILIRGVGSINATSAPLYVLNGVPYDGSIAAINNDDIESVTVLKDAAAAALYGSRAANGVIMITTKKGRRGKPVTTFNFRKGFQSRGIPEYDRVGPKDYYEVFWEAYKNNAMFVGGQDALTAGITASNVLTGPNGLVYNAYNVPGNKLVDSITGKLDPNAQLLWNESWEDALFRLAPRTNVNMSVSGAGEASDYYLSAGYLDEEGIMAASGYKRFNARLNVNAKATNWLSTGINLDGAMVRRGSVLNSGSFTSNPFYYTRNMGPIYPVYQHNTTTGAIIYDSTGKPALDWGLGSQMGGRPYAGNSNLVGSLELDERSSTSFNGNMNTFAEIKFSDNLSLKGTFGLNYFDQQSVTYQNNQFGDASSVAGRSTRGFARQYSFTGNQVLSYNKEFGNNNIRALVGHENYKFKINSMSATQIGFLFPGLYELTNGSEVEGPPTSSENNHTIESYFANVNYDYKSRYLLSASFRTDGSSRFAKDVRWGQFYSFGAGWRISQENFMKDVNWLNDLKLRASYGEQGNEDIGLFYQYRFFYYADGLGNYTPGTYPNPSLKWEKNATANLGLDFAMFKNRLTGTVEWFNRVSDNLLFAVPQPTSTGQGGEIWDNVGTMKNTGVELQLGYNPVMSKNFNWRVDLNLTHYKNKITKLPAAQAKNGIITGTKKLIEGGGIFDFWLPEFAGVDAATGDALYYTDILDAEGNSTGERRLTNVLNTSTTRYKMGSAIPDFSGGLTNSFNYKGFDLSILTTFAYGGKFYDGNYAGLMHRGDAGSAWHTDILDRWQKPGDVTNVPRVQSAGTTVNNGQSSRFLFDGSYINIKNITLSYTIPKNVVNTLRLNGLQVFMNVDNAVLFTAKKGMDPQRAFNGTSDASYVPFRTISFGFNLNLK